MFTIRTKTWIQRRIIPGYMAFILIFFLHYNYFLHQFSSQNSGDSSHSNSNVIYNDNNCDANFFNFSDRLLQTKSTHGRSQILLVFLYHQMEKVFIKVHHQEIRIFMKLLFKNSSPKKTKLSSWKLVSIKTLNFGVKNFQRLKFLVGTKWEVNQVAHLMFLFFY